MRICIFTPVFLPDVGGTETVTDALARQFQAQGHEAVVLALSRPAALDVPYRVHWAARPLLFPRLFPERVGRALGSLQRRERFDIVAANYSHPTGHAAVRLGARLGVPVVVISHGGDLYHTSKHRKRAHIWRRTVYTYHHADGLIAISPYIEALIREVNPRPPMLARIPNGVDLEEYARPGERPGDFADGRPFCLCLGNLGLMKGFDDAITAFAQVRGRMGGLAMVVVGSGVLEEPLRRQARELGLESDVVFMGRRTGAEKRWFLQNARFGLMPSREEGHPLVALEFLASGKPVICSTNPAFDGTYEDGVNGLRVPAQRPDLLGEAMLAMMGSDLATMGARCRERAAGFGWANIAGRYVEFFGQVIAAKKGDESLFSDATPEKRDSSPFLPPSPPSPPSPPERGRQA